jgi:hypothetical protein
MEILGLQVERESVGQQAVEGLRDGLHGGWIEIGRGIESCGGLGARLELRHFVVAHGFTSEFGGHETEGIRLCGDRRSDNDEGNFPFRSAATIT